MMMEMKKIYITPEVEIMRMNTADVMKASSESDKPVVPGAPARRTDVF